MKWTHAAKFCALLSTLATWLVCSGFLLNGSGSSNSPISVGTSTPVAVATCAPNRVRLEIDNENAAGGSAIYCAPGPSYPSCGAAGTTGGGITTFAPTGGGKGKWIPAGGSWVYSTSQTSQSPGADQYALTSEWDCVGGTGTSLIGVVESPNP